MKLVVITPVGPGHEGIVSRARQSVIDARRNRVGFSEEYRDGQGYEDNDFLWKLHAAGAKFKIRDDLITDHHDCPRSEWPAGGAKRNRMIFEQKWPYVG